MIYTTNYKNLWKVRDGLKILCITVGTPTVSIDNRRIFWCKELAPSWEIKALADEGKYEEYEKRYEEEILNKLDIEEFRRKYGTNIVLVCFCDKKKFCHRHQAAKYLASKLNTGYKEL